MSKFRLPAIKCIVCLVVVEYITNIYADDLSVQANKSIAVNNLDQLIATSSPTVAEFPSCSNKDDYWSAQKGDDYIPQAVASESTLVLSANSVTGQKDGVHLANGDVVAYKDSQTLTATWLIYNQNTSQTVGEDVVLTKEYDVMQGKWIDYSFDLSSGVIKQATAKDYKTGMYVTGDSIDIVDKDKYRAHNSFITSCDLKDPAWHITSKTTDVDYQDSQGVARNATFYVESLPIAYTPYMQFPLGKRHSGFLIPQIGSLNSSSYPGMNMFIDIPFYWNMAPNYDMTIAARYYSLSGLMVSDQFRYLTENGGGEIYTEQMPNDEQTGEHRYYWNMQDNHTIAPDWTIGYTFNEVSDDNYFVDFGNANSFSDNINLERSAYLRYKPYWGLFDIKFQGYQTLNPSNQPPAPNIYSTVPQINFNLNPLPVYENWLNFNLNSQFTVFKSGAFANNLIGSSNQEDNQDSPLQDGNRVVIYPSLTMPIKSSWGYITPKFGYSYTHYNLSPYADFYPNGGEVARELPITSVDSGLYFDRPVNWFGDSFVQTLEPRLYYLYIPQTNQADLPVFDTATATPNLNQLFSENRFSGYDRINSANDITLGVTSRLLNDNTGAELANWGVGYRHYLTPDNNLLYGSFTQFGQLYQPTPNFIAELNNNWANNISTAATFQYDSMFQNVDGYSLMLRYNPAPHKVINAKYAYQFQMPVFFYSWTPAQGYAPAFTENQKAVDLSGQWPLFSENWLLDGRFNYDLTREQMLTGLTGLEYNGGCWSVALLYEQFVTNATVNNGQFSTQSAYTQAYFVQFNFGGLAGVGTGDPTNELRNNIPGYAPVTVVR